MDPRKAAKVTAPDLLAAFEADTQGVGQAPKDSSGMRLWLVLFTGDGTPKSADDYPLAKLDDAMALITEHLAKGDGQGVVAIISATMPPAFRDAVQGISELER